jgi:2'-5' RNA ligase
LLIPFTDSDVLDTEETSRAKEVLARFAPTELSLAATAYFEAPSTVLYLQPEPATPFREMTEALVQAFPEHAPYGDSDAQIVPHLTVATRLGREELAAIEGEVAGKLPIRARASEAWLMEHAEQGWRLRDRVAFSAAA